MPTAREETSRLADLLRHEHDALADFLAALAAFDQGRRWSELGYTSLFSFLVRELGLSRGAAFYRNRAAELVRKYPAVLDALRDGSLCLSSVGDLSSVLTAENVSEVLPRYFHLSRSEAKAVTAELRPDPAPVLRTVVTAVPAAAHPPTSAAVTVAGFPENLLDANSPLPDGVPPAVKPPPAGAKVDPLTADLRRLHLTVSRRLLDKLATARDALSHSHPGASEETILELGLDLIIERHRKRRGIGRTPRKRPPESDPGDVPAPLPPPPGRSRHVPAAVRRAVWERDGGRCAWPLENGGVCGSTRQLELDHIEGWALGAETTPDACRLLCRPHQDVHARALYGDDLMNRYTRPEGPRCSEPVAPWAAREGAVASSSAAPSAGARVPVRGRRSRVSILGPWTSSRSTCRTTSPSRSAASGSRGAAATRTRAPRSPPPCAASCPSSRRTARR